MAQDPRTLPAMASRGRRLDRRTLLPRDYLDDPFTFGRATAVAWRRPAGGDEASRQVAMVQHQVAFLVGQRQDRTAAHRVSARFGFSKQYWSLCLHGQAWMGETVLAAAVSILLNEPRIKPQRP